MDNPGQGGEKMVQKEKGILKNPLNGISPYFRLTDCWEHSERARIFSYNKAGKGTRVIGIESMV